MTDYSTADEVAAAFADARPIFAGAFHTETYSIVQAVETRDDEGGYTTVDATVETGRCSLTVSQRMGGEGITGDIVGPRSLYTAELSTFINGELVASIVTEADTIEIDGRRFSVTDTKRESGRNPLTVVELEERG
ncbi:MAG: hypothetical protein M3440_05525 [Chloroflexota bacterium]|nr:hypothetical protein [Chloroflexota bacterium]